VTLTAAEVRRLLREREIRPAKALGQNFVADPNTVRRIVRLAGVQPGDRVVEVGPGLGSLTLALAEAGARVVALELDRRLSEVVREVTAGLDVSVVVGDALRVRWDEVLAAAPAGDSARGSGEPVGASGEAAGGPGDRPWTLVANLPYNVATPVVIRVLEEAPAIRSLLVMVQREVGERLAAGPGDDGYGATSVKVAYWASAEVVGRVPPTVFVPRPRVESVLVRILRLPVPAVDPEVVGYDRLFEVVRAGFGQRRKMLRRSLAAVVPSDAFAGAGVRPDARAEEIDLCGWARLAAWGAT
jgi:16S rRNA (adenine1518-N6/adenine1519-N6)-dimethyltransferase